MEISKKLSHPQRVYRGTVVLWAILVGADVAWYLIRAFAQLPTDEVYANSTSFQLMAYSLTRLPFWIIGLLAVLVVEMGIWGRRAKSEP